MNEDLVTPGIDPGKRDAVVAGAWAMFQLLWPEIDPAHGCLYLAVCAVWAASRAGGKLGIQCGSAHWRVARPWQTEGSTHYGYEWTPNDDPREVEFHAWNVEILKAGEGAHSAPLDPAGRLAHPSPGAVRIVDLSLGQQPKRAAERGLQWQTPLPRPYLWADVGDLMADPDAVTYRASAEGTDWAIKNGSLLLQAALYGCGREAALRAVDVGLGR